MSRKQIFAKATLILLSIICYLSLAVAPALAQEPDYDRINEIAKNLNCPTCAGLNLADCRTQTCIQWKGQIGDLIEAGYSDQEVLDDFVARYGEQVLQEPPKRGFSLILWVLPVLALLAGGFWLVYTLRGWANRLPAVATAPPQAAPDAPNDSDAYLQQVDQDLGIDL